MLWFYRILALTLAPLALWRLGGNRRERLGWITPVQPGGLWVHAASVGEVNAGRRLIETLLRHNPDHAVTVSTVTATGAERVRALFGERVTHRFLPLDTPGSVRRWLNRVQPGTTLIFETELWPELYHQLARRGTGPILVNARISPRAEKRYRWLRTLMARTLGAVDLIACQSRADAQRFKALGADPKRVQVTGNLKFDLDISPEQSDRAAELRALWGVRPVWVAGSTHAGEEEQLLAVHTKVREAVPDALLVLAPRHPERSQAVAKTIAGASLSWARVGEPAPGAAVVLVDRIGEMMACYAAGDIAFVGGSLVEIGGHNLLEPAISKRPVITGPHLQAQREIAEPMKRAGALIQVDDAQALAKELMGLFRDAARRDALGEEAFGFAKSGRGALEKTLSAIGYSRSFSKPSRIKSSPDSNSRS